jgi:hypothetical protein
LLLFVLYAPLRASRAITRTNEVIDFRTELGIINISTVVSQEIFIETDTM